MTSIKALLLRYTHSVSWKQPTLKKKNHFQSATQTLQLQTLLAKVLWNHRLLLVSALVYSSKTSINFYFNYFQFYNSKLSRYSKTHFNVLRTDLLDQSKRRKQLSLKLGGIQPCALKPWKWCIAASKQVLLKSPTTISKKLAMASGQINLFRTTSFEVPETKKTVVLFSTPIMRYRKSVKRAKNSTCVSGVQQKAVRRHQRRAFFRTFDNFKLKRAARKTVLSSDIVARKGLQPVKKAFALASRQPKASLSKAALEKQRPFLHYSKTTAKVKGQKRHIQTPKPKKPRWQPPRTIKEHLVHQQTLEAMQQMVIASREALEALERAEAEAAAAAEWKRKIESGEVDLTKSRPIKQDFILRHFFGLKTEEESKEEGSVDSIIKSNNPPEGELVNPALEVSRSFNHTDACPPITKAAPTSANQLRELFDSDVNKKEGKVQQGSSLLARSWHTPTTRLGSLNGFRDHYRFLRINMSLTRLMCRRVQLVGRNVLTLSIQNMFSDYVGQVLTSLPHQYVNRMFFITDLVAVTVATTLLRSSSILSFYLARLLERLPRHTWFFHIFNRVMSVFKYYCRAPISLKILIKGRINKKLRKQSVCVLRTQVALSTLDSSVDYCLTHSFTSASVLGVKVWVVSNSKAAKTKTFSQRYRTY